ncbi:hypothetical protein BMT55_13015 [Listeria newyorkensis]|uniref:Bacterial Ig domain-containing protein n=1 Tax=Listeria newyorkensis TaxID=1497681 RepID=A0ABX4XJG0_9LIST|nr:toxin Cry1Ac domain D-VI-related protein [Listeria newyorkensis]KGL45545.1 hypothetical protein EP58_03515 [Listeria newyorkensis]PNP89411.1 hypothetical protein BMT55_13015 [Listeria newyorkensis]WAO22982.1 toxin Cry1Ac domain D-VI-related protein [Listeria newyorkensis]SQC57170.1 Uncharacterised protein [Listeria newyorkensis]
MKNVLRKPIAIALTTLVLTGQTGISSIATFAAEEANTNGTQEIQGRAGVTVNVGTATELRNAMLNADVTDIYITADITLPVASIQGKGSKYIYGQGHTVDFANGNIYGDYNSVNTAQDLTIRNAGTYGGFFGGTGYSENTYKDVHFTGATQIMFNAGYAKLTLEGDITVDSTVSEAIYASNVTVKSGADVKISSTKSAIYIEQNKIGNPASAFTTEAGSNLLVQSKTGHAFFSTRYAVAAVTLGGVANFISDAAYAYYDEAAYYSQATSKALDLLPESETLILAKPGNSNTAFYGDLNIRDNADITIQAHSITQAAAIFSNKGLVAAPGANFRIVSASGNAIGGKVASKVVLQPTIGLSTWNLTTQSGSKPTNEYQFSKAEFSLAGFAPAAISVTNLTSDSAAFNNSFNPNTVREIAYGSYSTLADKEKELLAAAEASVKDLFNNGDVEGTIKDTTDQATIDKAQESINKVTDPAKKADLQKNLDEAQKQLNDRNNAAAEKVRQEAAEANVKDLFNDGNVDGTIKDTTNQEAIDKAQEAVNKVTDPTKKAELQKDLDEAKKQLEAKNEASAAEKARQEAAEASVKDLFNNGNVDGTIKDTTNQEAIDKAQEAINKVTDPMKKAELQKDLDEAKKQLEAKNAVIVRPTVNSVTNKDTAVTGNGTPGYTVVVKIGTETYTGVVGTDGKYSVNIPAQKADTTIIVEQKNAGKTGPSVTVKVGNYIPATAPIVDGVAPFQQAITGKAPAGTVSVRLIVNGVPQRLVAPDADGNFSFYSRFVTDGNVSNLRLKQGDIVTVDYGIRTPANLATSVTVSQAAKPIIDTIKAESDYVTGLVPTGTQVLRLSINGVPQRTVTPQANIDTVTAGGIGSNGRFKIYSRFFTDEKGQSRKLKAGDTVTVDLGAQIPGDTGTTVTVVAK